MAEYLVLEEDGTSRLDLEESTDSFLLEESSPHSGSVGFDIPVVFGTDAVGVDVEQHVKWKAGTLNVPGSPGSVSVTGLGGQPSAVFFFGTNWTAEDSVELSAGTGMFRGHAAPKWDDPGTIVQSAATATPPGNQHAMQNVAILMHTTGGSGTNLYGATFSSFDSDGFTVNFFTASGGGYKVVYVALMNAGNVGGYTGTGTTLGLGWKAGASMLHGAWAGSVVGGNDRTQEFYGGGAYPGHSHLDWRAAGQTVYSFPTSASSQFEIKAVSGRPDVRVTNSATFVGPFISAGVVKAYPDYLGDLTDFVLQSTASGTDGLSVVIWDDEDSMAGVLTPATAVSGTATVSGLDFEPGLVVGYCVSNEPQSTNSDGGAWRGAMGFTVATKDFQWSALVDGSPAQGAYQSFTNGFTDLVSGATSGVLAGTVELTEDGFVLTTQVTTGTGQVWAWHAFGHPLVEIMWVPNFYRRQLVN